MAEENTNTQEVDVTNADDATVLDTENVDAEVDVDNDAEQSEQRESEDTGSEDTDERVPSEDESESPDGDDDEDDDPYVPLSKLKKVRNEAKNLRERLKTTESERDELASKLAERDDSALQKQITALQTELQTERLSGSLAKAATDAGAIDPEILVTLVALEDVEWEGTQPANLDTIVTKLKEKYPKQFKRTTGSGNVGSRTESARKPLGEMSLQETERLAAEALKRS